MKNLHITTKRRSKNQWKTSDLSVLAFHSATIVPGFTPKMALLSLCKEFREMRGITRDDIYDEIAVATSFSLEFYLYPIRDPYIEWYYPYTFSRFYRLAGYWLEGRYEIKAGRKALVALRRAKKIKTASLRNHNGIERILLINELTDGKVYKPEGGGALFPKDLLTFSEREHI